MKHLKKLRLLPAMKAFYLSLLLTAPVFGAGFTEPPVTLYGEVVHLSEGTSYQVHDGEMVITLVNEATPSEHITLETSLGSVGSGGNFSYKIDIPQQYLPSSEDKTSSLSVSTSEASYHFASITINGDEARLLDTAQSLLSTSFTNRGNQHRLDLVISLAQEDTDGDGMPDWWEERYDLNPLAASDASSNTDGDDWTALQEFLRGSSPNLDNRAVTVANATILLPDDGTAGIWFPVIDTDATPADIIFAATAIGSGLSLSSSNFTYQDVLDGNIGVTATGDFSNSQIDLSVSDGNSNSTTTTLFFKALNPGSHNVEQPVLWVQAAELASNYSDGENIAAWGDIGGGGLVTFQPTTINQPNFSDSSAAFTDEDFFYLNDSAFTLSEYTALTLFSLNEPTDTDATLISTSDLDLFIGGTNQAAYAQTLKVTRSGESIYGPSIQTDSPIQVSLSGDALTSTLTVDGTAKFLSQDGGTLATTFGTLGAKQTIAETTASQFFSGQMKEVILFDTQLDSGSLSRLEDYQLSRWQSVQLWDFRSETSPITLTGLSTSRNSLNGGWGQDTLTGGPLADILRGGPANDTLAGNAGADRFQIFPGNGDDTILDFSESEGDILDLSPILQSESGLPTTFLTLTSEIVYLSGQVPSVSTKVALGNESITLIGVAFTTDDLPRLVGSGTFYLGGPRFESTISLAAEDTNLTETEYARAITLTRTGNLDASVDVYLSFVGSADLENDYAVTDRSGTGVIHKATFPTDVSEIQVDLTPIQDSLSESETIQIAVLPSANFPTSEVAPISLNLEDAPQISIESLVNKAQRLGSVPGIIQVSRDGNLTQPLDVRISFDGTAINGEDFVQVDPVVSFKAGELTKTINVTPSNHALDKGQPKLATVSIVPDTTQYATLSPWASSVMILDKLDGGLKDYDSFRAALPAQYNVEGGLANPDSDGISLYTEYVHGLDPTATDNPDAKDVHPFIVDGRFVMEVQTRAGLSDVRIFPAAFAVGLPDVSDQFEHSNYSLSDDRIMHVFTSRRSVSEVNQAQTFILRALPIAAPSLVTAPSTLLNSLDQTYLITGSQSGWTPSSDADGLAAAPRDSGENSSFETMVNGAQPVSFDWEVPANSGATITFTVDGITIDSITDGDAATTVNHTLTGSGLHKLKWTISYGSPSDSTLTQHGLVKNVSF